MTRFQPGPMLEVLRRHDVRFVLVGGMAALAHGAAHYTNDIDVTPERSRENLTRLSAALHELDARIRSDAVGDEVLPFAHDGESLARATVWNLVTRFGDLDLTVVPSGTAGYDDLIGEAMSIDVVGVEVQVASLRDVIRSKEAAGRPKDHAALPTLRRLLEQLEEEG